MADLPIVNYQQSWAKRLAAYKAAGVPNEAIRPIFKQDIEIFKRGGTPLSDLEATAQIARASGRGDTVNRNTERGSGIKDIIGNIVPDAANIFRSALNPHTYRELVNRIYNLSSGQVRGTLSQIQQGKITPTSLKEVNPGAFRQAIEGLGFKSEDELREWQKGKNPLEQTRDLLSESRTAASIVPGLTTGAQLTSTEGRKQMAQTPLTTGLDVLGLAIPVGRATTIGKALEAGASPTQAAAIAKGGRAGKYAAKEIFTPGSPTEALAAGRPLRALSRITPAGHDSITGAPLTLSDRVGSVAGSLGVGKAAREIATEVVTGRKLLRQQAEDVVNRINQEAADLGIDINNLEQRRDIAEQAMGLKVGKATPEQLAWIKQHGKELYDADPDAYALDRGGHVRSKEAAGDKTVLNAEEEIQRRGNDISRAVDKLVDLKQRYENDTDFRAKMDYYDGILKGTIEPNRPIDRAIAGKYNYARQLKLAKRGVKQAQSAVRKASKKAEKIRQATPPASAMPYMERLIKEELKYAVYKAMLDPFSKEAQLLYSTSKNFTPKVRLDVSQILAKIDDGLEISNVDIPKEFVKAIRRSVEKQWTRNPPAVQADYLPYLTPSRARNIASPWLSLEGSINPSLRKERQNVSATVNDVIRQISSGHIELAKANMSKVFAQRLIDTGKVLTKEDALRKIQAEVKAAAELNPAIDPKAMEQAVLNTRYESFNPEAYGIRQARVSGDYFIQKDIATAIRKMQWHEPNIFLRALTSTTGVFKNLALFNPSFILNNFFGNIGLGIILGNPLSIAREAPESLRMIRAARKNQDLTQFLGVNSRETAARLGLGTTAAGGAIELPETFKLAFGETSGSALRRYWESTGAKVNHRWQTVNSALDDFFKGAAYLAEYKQTGNVTRALDYATSVYVSLEKLTPVERTIIKQIIPFYTFQRHLGEALLALPADHPKRTRLALLAAEQDAQEEDLPDRFRAVLLFGSNGKTAHQLDTGMFNPYTDFADNFTLNGFLRSSNPIVRASAERLGYDTFRGEVRDDLGKQYDPSTQRLVTERPGALGILAKSFIPQYGRVFRGDEPNVAKLFTFGPAGRITDTVDIEKERFYDQRARLSEAQDAVSLATRTGDTSALELFDVVPFQGQMVPSDILARYIKEIRKRNDSVAPRLLIPPQSSRSRSGPTR